jgi:hypothetical protein
MPVVRVVSVDEAQFLTSLKHNVWGSNTARFKHWQIGDMLIFVVNKALAGAAEIAGEPFVSDEPLWENSLFAHRIPLRFRYAIQPEVRPPISGDVWDALVSAWGTRYGWGLANQSALPDESAEILLDAIEMRPNDLDAIRVNIDGELHRARSQRGPRMLRFRPIPRRIARVTHKLPDESSISDTLHTKTQYELIRLGRVTGCSVWVASNDRSRVYEGKPLGTECLKTFPNLGLTKEARDRIALIDILWIRRSLPVYAFEVEVTSAVYSGLLRMSDLLAVVPLLNIKLFIVAPRERQDKVMRELARPTFQKIGLAADCRFIALEDLSALLAKVGQLGGHLQPSVVETIAIAAETHEESSPTG